MPPFVVADFLQRYPQFSGVFTPLQIEDAYNFEALVVGSKIIALFKDVNYQFYWAQVVLAHILTIMIKGTNGSEGYTGRIAAATEGSVSVNSESSKGEDEAWWNITPYGQKCWQLIRKRGGATMFGARNTGWNPWL